MNYGDGKFIDETNTRIKSQAYLDKAHGEGSLFVADANGDGVNDIIHSSTDFGATHGATIYLNNKGVLEVMDDSEFAWVQSWQIEGYEKTRNPNALITNKSNKMYPIDLDGKNGVDFISSIAKPNMNWPAQEPQELVFYSILSLNPNGDNDKDGVINRNDVCGSTPAGIKVDAKGCEIILAVSKEYDSFEVSPNPFEREIKIKFPQNFGSFVQVEIIDLKGASIFRKSMLPNETQIDLAFLSPGNYLLKLVSELNGKMQVMKISKTVK
jgi:hypothetical protein